MRVDLVDEEVDGLMMITVDTEVGGIVEVVMVVAPVVGLVAVEV